MGFWGGGSGGVTEQFAGAEYLEAQDSCRIAFHGGPRLVTQRSGYGADIRNFVLRWFDTMARVVGDTLTSSDNAAVTGAPRLAQKNVSYITAGGVLGIDFRGGETEGNGGIKLSSEGRTALDGADGFTVVIPIYIHDVGKTHTIFDMSTSSSNTTSRFRIDIKSDASLDVHINDGTTTTTENTGAGTLEAAKAGLLMITGSLANEYGSDAGDIRVYWDGDLLYSATGILTGSAATAFPTGDPGRTHIGCTLSYGQFLDAVLFGFYVFNTDFTANQLSDIRQAINQRVPIDAMQIVLLGDSNTSGKDPTEPTVTDTDTWNRNRLNWQIMRYLKNYGYGFSAIQNLGSSGSNLLAMLDSKKILVDTTNDTVICGIDPNFSVGTPLWFHALNYLPGPLLHYTKYYAGTLSEIEDTFGASDVNTSTGVLTLTSHTFTTGDPVQLQVQSGGSNALPTGWTGDTWYYIYDNGVNEVTLHANATDAGTGANPVIPSDQGVGTAHKIGWYKTKVYPTSSDASGETNAIDLTSQGSGAYVRGFNSGGYILRPENITDQPGMKQVLSFDMGRNDAAQNRNGDWVYRMWSTQAQIFREDNWLIAANWVARIADSGQDAYAETLNQNISDNSFEADAVIEHTTSASYDSNNYIYDGVHFTYASNAKRGQEIANAIKFIKDKTFSIPYTQSSTLHAWWDFTDEDNMTLSGTDVTFVRDKSGNGMHIANRSGSNTPAKTANGVHFDGNDYLTMITPALDKFIRRQGKVHIIAVIHETTNASADRGILEVKKFGSATGPELSYYLYTPSASFSRPTIRCYHGETHTIDSGSEVDASANIVVPDATATVIEAALDMTDTNDIAFYVDDVNTDTNTTAWPSTGVLSHLPPYEVNVGNFRSGGNGNNPFNGTLKALFVILGDRDGAAADYANTLIA